MHTPDPGFRLDQDDHSPLYMQLARKLASELAGSRRVPNAVAERAAALADDVEEIASSVTDA